MIYERCPHAEDETRYSFELEGWELDLCEDCFYILASEINKQLVIDQMTQITKKKDTS